MARPAPGELPMRARRERSDLWRAIGLAAAALALWWLRRGEAAPSRLRRGRPHPAGAAAVAAEPRPAGQERDQPARALADRDDAGRQAGHRQGRDADRPSQIPLRGWRAILLRVKDEIAADNLSVIAAGVAFFTLLALVPGFAALVSIYGMIADPADLERQLAASSGVLPEDAQRLIAEQLHAVVGAANSSLSLAALISILVSLWSAMSGVKTVFTALNVAYDETEKRGFFRLNLIALLFTLGGIVGIIVVLGFIVAVPIALDLIGFGSQAESLISLLRWPILGVLLLIALAMLYRYGPSREKSRWRWVSWGAVLATVLWLVGSLAFSFYVANFASYNETYGSLGGIIILLMWLYLSAFIVLIGAELNAEMEHQTARDSTAGPERPLGARGAYVADHVAEAR